MKTDAGLSRDQRILRAAEKIFPMYGYEKATLDQIIALADVGKGTVYKYFGNKEQLFYKLVIDKNKKFVQRLRQAVDGVATLQEKLTAYFRAMVAFYYENSHLWQIIFFEMLSANNSCRIQRINGEYRVLSRYSQAEITDAMKEKVLRYYNILEEEYIILENIIAGGIADGSLKQGDPQITSKYLFFGVAMSIFNSTSSIQDKVTSEEASDLIVDRFLYGESVR